MKVEVNGGWFGSDPFHILFNSNRLYLSIDAEKKASLDFHPRAHIKCAALALFYANLIAQESENVRKKLTSGVQEIL